MNPEKGYLSGKENGKRNLTREGEPGFRPRELEMFVLRSKESEEQLEDNNEEEQRREEMRERGDGMSDKHMV